MAAYHFFAVCPRTLEPILAQELQSLGAQSQCRRRSFRGTSVLGDERMLEKPLCQPDIASYCYQTVLRQPRYLRYGPRFALGTFLRC